MFVVHVDSVVTLRTFLRPLTYFYSRADIKCSVERFSIVIFPYHFPYVVSLRLSPAFFTTFRFFPDGDDFEHYRSGFLLDDFVGDLFAVHDDAVSLFIFLCEFHRGVAPLIFDLPSTGYLQYASLIRSHPINIDVPNIEFGAFVAIQSVEFLLILTELLVISNETVYVTLTESKVKFSVLFEEVVLTTEDRQCVIGSLPEGSEVQFTLNLEPMDFFADMAFMSKWVWLFKTVSHRDMMSFTLELDAGCLICF